MTVSWPDLIEGARPERPMYQIDDFIKLFPRQIAQTYPQKVIEIMKYWSCFNFRDTLKSREKIYKPRI